MIHDICIVGAGLGGLFAAKELSENGIRPLVLERNKNVTDAACGELVGGDTLKILEISKDSEIVSNKIHRGEFISLDSGKKMEFPEKLIREFYLLDSSLLKEHLKEVAESNGATFKFKSNVVNVIKSKGSIRGVKTVKNDYKSNITVGTDGSRSIISKKGGFDFDNLKDLPAVRFKLKNCKGVDSDCMCFYLGRKIGIGYLWLYPRSRTEANLGISSINSRNMVNILTDFIKNKPELRHSRIVNSSGDTVSYSGLIPRFVGNGVLLVGESAGQVSNLVGGGVETTLIGAKMASQVIIKAVESHKYSEEYLKEYEENYRNSDTGIDVQNTAKYLSKIIEFSKKTDLFVYIEEIIESVEPNFIGDIVRGKFSRIMILKELLKHPLLIRFLEQLS